MINSNVKPQHFVIGKNSSIINYSITENIDDESVVSYNYLTQEFPATKLTILEQVKAKLEQANVSEEYLDYLKATDWMVLREMDGGELMPLDIKLLRATARTMVL